jgi:hypothetical protein
VINRIRYAGALLLALAAVPALAQKPQIQWNDEYDFDAVETFQWQAVDDASLAAANPFMHSLIKNQLESHLATSGLIEVTENPDIFITYYGAQNTEVQLRSDSYGYSYGGYGMGGWGHYGYGSIGPVSTTTRVVEIQHGTLVVDIWDAETMELVWRGTVTDVMPSDPEKAEKTVIKAIEKLVAQGRKLWEKEHERRAEAAEDAARN